MWNPQHGWERRVLQGTLNRSTRGAHNLQVRLKESKVWDKGLWALWRGWEDPEKSAGPGLAAS